MYLILKNEIQTDPVQRGYSGKSPDEQASLINAPYKDLLQPLPISELIIWLAGVNGFAKLETITNSSPVYSIARALLAIVQSPSIEFLWLSDPRIVAMAEGLVVAEVFTEVEKETLFTAATAQISRAQELGLPEVNAGHIFEALGGVY